MQDNNYQTTENTGNHLWLFAFNVRSIVCESKCENI